MSIKHGAAFSIALASLSLVLAGRAGAVLPPDSGPGQLSPAHVPGQLLIRYKQGIRSDYIEARLTSLGLGRLQRFQALGMDLVALPPGIDVLALAAELEREPMVALAEPNFIFRPDLRPDDTRFTFQWHLENNGANYVGSNGAGLPGADLNAVTAWDTEADASTSIIAIIDDAVETTHEDLSANIQPGGGCFDSATGHCGGNPSNANPTGGDQDHGTLVAGTAAARGNNGIGIAGVAWQARILPYKTDLTNAAIAAAINDAITKGAHIINMSFGGPTPSQSILAALSAAQASGILAVASAGNSDANNDRSKAHYPSNYDVPNLIAVAASDGYDDITGFSQWGSFIVELAAPGSLVQTTAVNNSYRAASGTSFASPAVAGVAALVRAHTGASGPDAWKRMRAHLLHGGVNGVGLGPTLVPGRDRKAIPGRVQAGRLDAARALAGPTGGVLLINGFTVDDSASGNGNGLLDANENADLVIEVENIWTAETGVVGTLVPYDTANNPSAFDSGQLTVNVPVQTFGTIGQDQQVSARFPVSLGNVTQNEQYFFTLELTSDNGPLSDRYFVMEVGTLENGVTVTQAIQRLNFDEFHAWHVDVPPGATNLVIATTADNPGGGTCSNGSETHPASIDIDLIVRYDETPEYSIALDPPEGEESFYVNRSGPNPSLVDGNCGGHEQISIANPQAGTYHIVVVNFDQIQHDYTITASFDAPQEGTIVLDASSYAAVEDQGTVTVSASRTGGAGAVSVNFQTADGSAVEGADYTPASGVLSWADGETGSKTFQITLTDDADFEDDESFTVALSGPTGGAALGSPAAATITIEDDDNPGELRFESAAYLVAENGLVARIGIERVNGSRGALAVDYTTADGSAAAGEDYLPASGTVTWGDGQSGPRFFDVTIIEDPLLEGDETVLLSISNPSPAVPLGVSSAILTIDDNDDPGSVSFDQGSYSVDETGGSITLSVTRSGGDLAGGASVDFSTRDGTATAGSDYVAQSGTLTWLAGEGGSRTISVAITDDTDFESTKGFFIDLANPSSGLVIAAPATAAVAIADDDDPGALQFSVATRSVSESAGTITITVERVSGTSGAVNVAFATAGGSAASGSDFEATSGTLSWADGETGSKTFTINILEDTTAESAESFTVNLSAPSGGARLGSPASLVVTINASDQPVGGGGGGGGGAPNPLLLLAVLPLVLRARRQHHQV